MADLPYGWIDLACRILPTTRPGSWDMVGPHILYVLLRRYAELLFLTLTVCFVVAAPVVGAWQVREELVCEKSFS